LNHTLGKYIFDRINKLFILDIVVKNGKTYFQCSCDCGILCEKDVYKVLSGHTKSCGCNLVNRDYQKRHGGHKSSEYGTWEAMKARCNNPKNKKYRLYGGRGIKVCDRWNDFVNFYEDMGLRPEGLTLERIDSDGNYCPDNCKWATYSEQNRNTTQNHYLTLGETTLTIVGWAERLGWDPAVIHARLKYGWSIEDTLTIPKRNRSPNGTREAF
jgi:hypothetical protein